MRTCAELYREVSRQAVAEKDLRTVVERILIDSVHEFTRPSDVLPGRLLSSVAMTDRTSTLDTSAYYAELQGWNEQTLFARVERAIRDGEPDLDGEVAAGVDPAALTGLVQSVVHGFSVQANLGTAREGLLATAQLAHKLICRQLTSPTP
ncbi:TetR/AcrR family transcriptional regulator [Streptomyces noursei]|uniref:TetR/AcrR family transcriptional regulator n=1 Tax=Streptomyces noursei TaxID=1971 RepID=UPI0030F1C77A